MTNELSVVVPILNEERNLEELLKRIEKNIKEITSSYQIIVIDDGSTDNSWEILLKKTKDNEKIKAAKFDKNFGQHQAIEAGLKYSEDSKWVIVMDGDLQDLPEEITKLYSRAITGKKIVFAARKNREIPFWYKVCQKFFYESIRLLTGIRHNNKVANFSIISGEVARKYVNSGDSFKFYPLHVKSLGFEYEQVEVISGKRFAGKPSYSVNKRIILALKIYRSLLKKKFINNNLVD